VRVADDTSPSQVPNFPSLAAEPIILGQGSNITSSFLGDEICMEQLQSQYLNLVGATNTSPQPPTLQSSSHFQTPETNIIHDNHSNQYSPYGEANFELFIPDTSTSPSGPRSAYASITYNQDIDSSYIMPCFFCSAGHQCVVHTSESNYLIKLLLKGIEDDTPRVEF
jgi:hypothetical protein